MHDEGMTKFTIVALTSCLVACTAAPDESTPPDLEPSAAHPSCNDGGGIMTTPPEHAAMQNQGFDRMTSVTAPNGKTIPIFAQDQVSDLQLLRARNVLRFFLTPVAESQHGAVKDDVANAMADNNAVLIMPNGADGDTELTVEGQPLYWSETPVEGSSWYMNNDWDHRDAALEEIFHLVHDTGIGTDQPGARPDYQAALLAEAQSAVADGRWGIGAADWLTELSAEGSLAQEYVVSVMDSYYGLWGAWEETPGGMWGIYIAKNRAEVASLDPNGQELLLQFLPPMLQGYEARLDPELDGVFSITFDANVPYTHKSQYLVDVVLTGDNDVELVGNAANNVLRGNLGANRIDGAEGSDTVVYCNPAADYSITVGDDGVDVTGPDGHDQLTGVELIHFADGVMRIE